MIGPSLLSGNAAEHQDSQSSRYVPLPQPVRISDQQWPEGTRPVVSICCITYNHKPFIRDAIEGFLVQETTFPVEILIHDDASNDGTQNIIREYTSRFPLLIRPKYQAVNQYSQGIHPGKFTRGLAKGNYIAYCEGDDFWTDAKKLQRQVEFLESNEDYVLSVENSMVVYLGSGRSQPFSERPEGDVGILELLGDRFFGTASAVCRRDTIVELEASTNITGDVINWCLLATRGRIHYRPLISSVYRRGMQGVVMSTPRYSWAMQMRDWNKELRRIVPPTVPDRVFRDRNFRGFWNAFVSSIGQGDWSIAIKSALRCLSCRPLLFIVRMLTSTLNLSRLSAKIRKS